MHYIQTLQAIIKLHKIDDSIQLNTITFNITKKMLRVHSKRKTKNNKDNLSKA